MEQVLRAVRRSWPERIRESSPSVDEAEADPCLTALSKQEKAMTVAQLEASTGWSQSRVRRRLKSLEEASLVTVDRKTRPFRYRVSRPAPRPAQQLGLFGS